MRALNHALTGAVIGLTLPVPIALPLALVSHYVLDGIPHYGSAALDNNKRLFNVTLAIDAALCVVLVMVLAISSPANWLWAAIAAFLATAPDLMWIPTYLRRQNDKALPEYKGWWIQLHKKIQWYERPNGLYVELVWLAGAVYILDSLL